MFIFDFIFGVAGFLGVFAAGYATCVVAPLPKINRFILDKWAGLWNRIRG